MKSFGTFERAAITLAMALAGCLRLFALNPFFDVSQYAHTTWKVGEGFSKGPIRSIAQTPDGYLWLGTEFGLLRFDGVRAIPWQPAAGEHLASSYIRSLRVARDGRLWIGTFNGLASWKDGKLTHYPELDGQITSPGYKGCRPWLLIASANQSSGYYACCLPDHLFSQPKPSTCFRQVQKP